MNVRSKKALFFIITLSLPVLFFVIFELALRIFQYGENLNLVLEKEENGRKFYQLNEHVAKRFFTRTPARIIPQLYPQTFEFDKSPQSVRVFLMGGSTMAGFPYELNARINSLLQDRLVHYYPDKKIEVINVGLSAINSFTVAEFTEELLKYQPDLFIFYLGHNEFYGAFGVGSMENLGKVPVISRTYMALRQLKIFVLLRDIYSKISTIGNDEADTPNRTLMASMVQKKTIAFGSADYKRAHDYFAQNLARILETCRSNRVPALVSTIVSNLRGQPPFYSMHRDSLSEKDKAQWNTFFEYGKKYSNHRRYMLALSSYEDAKKIDAMPADLHYAMGECFLALGDSLNAKKSFQQARDLDGLRFRASTEINSIIKSVCTTHRAALIDASASFDQHSKHGIPGNELITEHLHPNFEGYFLLAKIFAQAIDEFNFFSERAKNLSYADDYFEKIAHVTLIDKCIGNIKIEKLTSGWPYTNKVTVEIQAETNINKMVHQFATQYYTGQISWNEAHNKMAAFYSDNKMYDRAIEEYLAVTKVVPDNYFPYFKIGNIHFIQNNLAEAERWFGKARELNHDATFIPAKLGMVYMLKKDYSKAIHEFEQALKLDDKKTQLSNNEKILAHYYLAVSYVSLNQRAKAKEELNEVLRLNPSHAEARHLRELLNQNKNIQIQL